MVAMSEEKAKEKRRRDRISSRRDSEEEDDEDMNPQESLLQLVSPELKDLSGHWLAALKDYALLSLPSEYSGQLPHDGGSFFSWDTMDAVRPLYRQSWPPILQAAALWLCTSSQESDTMHAKDFNLLYSMCLEALCSPRATDPISNMIVCLKSLHTLVRHRVLRSLITQDQNLGIELCSILHRLLLTRESPECQLLVLEISSCVVDLLQEVIEEERKSALRNLAPANQKLEQTEIDALLAAVGHGGQLGQIKCGQSIVYSLLEICLCVLVRQLPELSPEPSPRPMPGSSSKKLTRDLSQLVSASLVIISRLPELCSPKGSVMVLPPVVHLMTGVLKESAQFESNAQREIVVSSLLESYTRITAGALSRNTVCCQEWTQMLQAALSAILDLSNSCSDEATRPDEPTIIAIMSIFITNCSPQVVCVPNLLFPCINFLKQRLDSPSQLVCISL